MAQWVLQVTELAPLQLTGLKPVSLLGVLSIKLLSSLSNSPSVDQRVSPLEQKSSEHSATGDPLAASEQPSELAQLLHIPETKILSSPHAT